MNDLLGEGIALSLLAIVGKLEEWKTKVENHKQSEKLLIRNLKGVTEKVSSPSERNERKHIFNEIIGFLRTIWPMLRNESWWDRGELGQS